MDESAAVLVRSLSTDVRTVAAFFRTRIQGAVLKTGLRVPKTSSAQVEAVAAGVCQLELPDGSKRLIPAQHTSHRVGPEFLPSAAEP